MLSIRSLWYTVLLLALGLSHSSAWAIELSKISGQVVDGNQQPIPNAQVFLEQGLLSPLTRVISDQQGEFEFNDVLPGTVGVIAYAPGHAFNGASIKIGTGDIKSNLTIALPASGQLSGHITNLKDKPVANAYITRALLQSVKVSIPYTKLRKFGFILPTSNIQGQFTLTDLPINESVVIKVSHSKHAQGLAAGLKVGTANTKVKLSPGVMISGTIRTSDTNEIVPKAAIIFRNNRPPYATTLAQANAEGIYFVRVQPGDYTYESIGANYTSVSKPRFLVTGQLSTEEINLTVAPKVTLSGKVMDAQTGKGISGARVRLETQGQINAFALTGQQGEYTFSAPAGEATIRYLQASGYQPPAAASFNIPVKTDEVPPMPTFWLIPLPTYSLAVVDTHKKPLANAIVQVLDPPQIGWRTTDAQGMVSINLGSMPKSGQVIGYVEHPGQPEGAAFSIGIKEAQEAIVQLIPQKTLQGRIVNAKGQGLEGWTVTCQIAQENAASSVTLWNTISDSEGKFQHPGVLQDAPLVYSASLQHEGTLITTPPQLHVLTDDASSLTLPDLIVANDYEGKTSIGKKFPWSKLTGESLESIRDWKGKRVVIFAQAQQAAMVLEVLERQQEILQTSNARLVLAVADATGLSSDTIPICTGEAPSGASVYIISAENRILSESHDLPTPSVILNSAN